MWCRRSHPHYVPSIRPSRVQSARCYHRSPVPIHHPWACMWCCCWARLWMSPPDCPIRQRARHSSWFSPPAASLWLAGPHLLVSARSLVRRPYWQNSPHAFVFAQRVACRRVFLVVCAAARALLLCRTSCSYFVVAVVVGFSNTVTREDSLPRKEIGSLPRRATSGWSTWVLRRLGVH